MRFRAAERRVDEERTDVRAAILSAAERLLENRRLDELTVVDMIEEAGVSRASFYMYFESKHAVVAALAEVVTTKVFDKEWGPWLSGCEPHKQEILVDHMRATIALWHKHRGVLVATAAGWRTHAEAYSAWGDIMRSYIADTRAYIERARAAGAAPPGLDAGILAGLLVWGNESALYLRLTGQAPEFADEDEERLAITLAGLWWRAIYADSPA
jgi:AcrR family transcriptional regulator